MITFCVINLPQSIFNAIVEGLYQDPVVVDKVKKQGDHYYRKALSQPKSVFGWDLRRKKIVNADGSIRDLNDDA